jgi:hypothetical protein
MSPVSRPFSECANSSSGAHGDRERRPSRSMSGGAAGCRRPWPSLARPPFPQRLEESPRAGRPRTERRARPSRRPVEEQHPRGQQPDPLGVQLEALGDLRARLGRQHPHAALEGLVVEDGPTSRRSDVALPPTPRRPPAGAGRRGPRRRRRRGGGRARARRGPADRCGR